jgi:hypothetical protein
VNASDRRLTPIELITYAAGAAIALVGIVAPRRIWAFPVDGLPPLALPVLVLVALGAALWSRAQLSARRERAPLHGVAVFAIAALVLWLLRCRMTYGDARTVERLVGDGVLFVKREPLSPAVFVLVHRSLGGVFGWTPVVSVQVVNTLAGAFGVVVLVGLARRIAGRAAAPAAVVLVGCGSVQLFAGYVEMYTLSTVCMLAGLACGLDALAGRRGPIAAFALWTLSCMFHLSGVVFLPAMLWLAYHAGLRRFDRRALVAGLRLASVTVVPAIALYVVMRWVGYEGAGEPGMGGGDGGMFVPLFELSGMTRYLMFRPAHLLAIANEQLLVAPLGIVTMLAGAACALRRRRLEPAPVYLGLVAAGFLLLTVTWNPDFGPLKDWDLFGPVGFYLGVAGVALLAAHLRDEPARLHALLWFVAIVNVSRALPFVLYNAGM